MAYTGWTMRPRRGAEAFAGLPELPPRVVAAVAVAGAAIVLLNAWKILHSGSVAFHDYGKITSMIMNTAMGDPVPMRPADAADSHLGVHFHPLLYAFVLVAKVLPWQNLWWYAVALAWFGAVTAFTVLIARVTGRATLGVAGGVLLFLNVYMRRALLGPHYEHLQVLFVLLAATAFLRGRWAAYGVMLALACAVREDAALYAAGFSLGLAWHAAPGSPSRRAGLLGASVAAAYFLLAWYAVMPAFQPPDALIPRGKLLAERWRGGETLAAVILHHLVHPGETAASLWTHRTLRLLLAFGALPLLVPRFFLVACLPPVLVLSMSIDPAQRGFRWYTSTVFLGPWAVGAALGLGRLLDRRKLPARGRTAAVTAVAVAAALAGVWPRAEEAYWGFGLLPGSEPFAVTGRGRAVARLLRDYPYAGRSVAASPTTFPHIASRPNVWYISRWEAVRPDLVVFDERRDDRAFQFEFPGSSAASLRRDLARAGYRREELHDGCYVYTRRTPPRP